MHNRFFWPNGQLLPIYTIHILKAIVPAVNLAYLDTIYMHPVIHTIFVTFGTELTVLAQTLSYGSFVGNYENAHKSNIYESAHLP